MPWRCFPRFLTRRAATDAPNWSNQSPGEAGGRRGRTRPSTLRRCRIPFPGRPAGELGGKFFWGWGIREPAAPHQDWGDRRTDVWELRVFSFLYLGAARGRMEARGGPFLRIAGYIGGVARGLLRLCVCATYVQHGQTSWRKRKKKERNGRIVSPPPGLLVLPAPLREENPIRALLRDREMLSLKAKAADCRVQGRAPLSPLCGVLQSSPFPLTFRPIRLIAA